MNTVEVIKSHLCKYQTDFIFNVAEDLGMSVKDIRLDEFTVDITIDGQLYRILSVKI